MIQRLRQWWSRPQPATAQPEAFSAAFVESCASQMLEGCADSQSRVLRLRIADARHRDDLLHLRPLVYDCIARRFGEPEAQRRLAVLHAQLGDAGRRPCLRPRPPPRCP